MTESRKFVFNKVNVTKNNDVEPLKYYLDLQESILDKLTRVIQSEYEALRDRMVARLSELSSAKSDLMLKLQSNDQKIKLHPDVDKLKISVKDLESVSGGTAFGLADFKLTK